MTNAKRIHPLYEHLQACTREAEKAAHRLNAQTKKCPLRLKAQAAETFRQLSDAEERAERDWQEWCEAHRDLARDYAGSEIYL